MSALPPSPLAFLAIDDFYQRAGVSVTIDDALSSFYSQNGSAAKYSR
jgi:hypothetical protein